MTTLNTSGLHQTIVMAHQQVALDLLQSVEYHTDHDQQRRTSVEVVNYFNSNRLYGRTDFAIGSIGVQ